MSELSVLRRAFDLVLILFILAAVLLCAGWGGFNFRSFAQQHALLRMSTQVVAGASFGPGVLEDFVKAPNVNIAGCKASVLRAETIVRLRLLENAMADAQRLAISENRQSLQVAFDRALSCSPTDGFLWLLGYWLELTSNGVSNRALEFLRMSYLRGPNEGWVAVKRNGLALAAYSQLPDDLKQKVVPEFVGLVSSGLINEAADIVSGPGTTNRSMLISALAGVEDRRKADLSRTLRGRGIDLDIPGLPPLQRRPWN